MRGGLRARRRPTSYSKGAKCIRETHATYLSVSVPPVLSSALVVSVAVPHLREIALELLSQGADRPSVPFRGRNGAAKGGLDYLCSRRARKLAVPVAKSCALADHQAYPFEHARR